MAGAALADQAFARLQEPGGRCAGADAAAVTALIRLWQAEAIRIYALDDGELTTGSDCTSPTTSTNSAESQQETEGSLGFRTYHQVESWFLPIISACLPTSSAPITAMRTSLDQRNKAC